MSYSNTPASNGHSPRLPRQRLLYISSAFKGGKLHLYLAVDEFGTANAPTRIHHPGPASVARLHKLVKRYKLHPKQFTLDPQGPSLYIEVFGSLREVRS